MFLYSSTLVGFEMSTENCGLVFKEIRQYESGTNQKDFVLSEPETGYMVLPVRGSCHVTSLHDFCVSKGEVCLLHTSKAKSSWTFRPEPGSGICVISYTYTSPETTDRLVHIDVTAGQTGEGVYEYFRMLLKESYNRQMNWQQICNHIIGILYTMLRRSASLSEYEPEGNNVVTIAESVKNYIDVHYAENIRIPDIARALFISESSVSHSFARSYDMTVSNYIQKVRIEHAKELLKNSKLSIELIANQTGFSCMATFYRNFGSCTGMSPGEYRLSMRKES